MILLADLDDTTVDWSGGYDGDLDLNPLLEAVPRKAGRLQWDLLHGLEPDVIEHVKAILNADGFYERLAPLPGAVEALEARLSAGDEVFLVSTPWHGNPNSAAEKTRSVIEHFGRDWIKRLILTHDKTLVHGDLLIDDRTTIKGARQENWTRVYFDQPWNRPDFLADLLGLSTPQTMDIRGLRMKDWDNLDTIVEWVAHIRDRGHSILGKVDDLCTDCFHFHIRAHAEGIKK